MQINDLTSVMLYGVACGFLKDLTVDGIWDAHNAFTLLCIEVFLDRT